MMTARRFLVLILVIAVTAILAAQQPGKPNQTSRSIGPKRTLFLVTKSATSTPRCSNAMVNAAAFTATNSVAAYLAETSYGLVSLSGDVVGPYTVTVGTTCDRRGWATAADAGAAAAGVTLSDYDIRFYVTPPDAESLCTARVRGGRVVIWRGTYNTTTKQAWVNDSVCDSPHYIAGSHVTIFGENHAQTPGDNFGDVSSVTGGDADLPENVDLVYTSPHLNAPGLITIGWLPERNVQTVTTGGRYRVAFLEAATAAVQVLKIHTTGPANDATDYYFSYRRAVGFDSTLRRAYVDNTSVHAWSGDVAAATFLLANIGDGQSWSNGKVTVRQTAHDATYAYLTVSFP